MDETAPEVTKPCPRCGKRMIEVQRLSVDVSFLATYRFVWRCYGCGHVEFSRTWLPELRDADRERWTRANRED